MIIFRIYNISTSLIQDFDEKIKKALCDQDPSVMGASLNVYFEIIKKEGAS
jgi:AP-4 complex subunit epsilon-1